MEIVLLRHGVPQIDTTCRLSAAEFGAWVRAYDKAGIDARHPAPPEAMAIAGTSALVLCSPLPRATQSAIALGATTPTQNPMFREIEIPFGDWRLPRLSPRAWSVVFRLMWVAGFARDCETFSQARARASYCAERLAQLAAAHGRVLLVGHGALNWAIARALTRDGWHGPAQAPRRHWEFGIYRFT